jgi:hypothetical protein
MLLLLSSGCYCHRYDYASFAAVPDIQVVGWTLNVREYGSWVPWPVPRSYKLARSDYSITIATILPGHISPDARIRAADSNGIALSIAAAGEVWQNGWSPEIRADSGSGEVSFQVLRGSEVIGNEALRYEIRTRPFACESDLP